MHVLIVRCDDAEAADAIEHDIRLNTDVVVARFASEAMAAGEYVTVQIGRPPANSGVTIGRHVPLGRGH